MSKKLFTENVAFVGTWDEMHTLIEIAKSKGIAMTENASDLESGRTYIFWGTHLGVNGNYGAIGASGHNVPTDNLEYRKADFKEWVMAIMREPKTVIETKITGSNETFDVKITKNGAKIGCNTYSAQEIDKFIGIWSSRFEHLD